MEDKRILIYKGQEICYDLVDLFAEEFAKELEKLGFSVEIFDMKKEAPGNVARYLGQHFSAIVDFYSGMLGITMQQSGAYFLDMLEAPVYQFVFDYPLYIQDKMQAKLKEYYVLVLDYSHVRFINKYQKNIKKSYFLPPAGKKAQEEKRWEERKMDLAFVGTYRNYRIWLERLEECDDTLKLLGKKYFGILREHPWMNQEEGFLLMLEELGIVLEDEQRLQWMQMLGGIGICISNYYREEIIRTILDSGLKLHVFGESWKESPFTEHSCLIQHEEIRQEEYAQIMTDVKIALNIMPWNKEGFTERISYAMLNGAVCVTDTSKYLQEQFEDGKNIVFYSLEHIEELPEKLKSLMESEQRAETIAKAGKQIAEKNHTWKNRAEDFAEILRKM